MDSATLTTEDNTRILEEHAARHSFAHELNIIHRNFPEELKYLAIVQQVGDDLAEVAHMLPAARRKELATEMLQTFTDMIGEVNAHQVMENLGLGTEGTLECLDTTPTTSIECY